MAFPDRQSERCIRQTLRRLARQRAVEILQPGNVWLVENALVIDDDTRVILLTCEMRGWVDRLHNAIPRGDLQPDGRLPSREKVFNRSEPIYRLTEGGWAVINRDHFWVLSTFYVALLGGRDSSNLALADLFEVKEAS